MTMRSDSPIANCVGILRGWARTGFLVAFALVSVAIRGPYAQELDALLDREQEPTADEEDEEQEQGQAATTDEQDAGRAKRPGVKQPSTKEEPSHVSRRHAQREIEEIIVTARKRAESIQDVPVAVTAMTGKHLQSYQISTFTELAESVPQLLVSEGATGPGGVMSLRGIGSSVTSPGFEQPVATVADGFASSRGNVFLQGFFDVERVEVLKGPQALFFGKNSPAGVVSIKTADPGPEPELIGRFTSDFLAEEFSGEAIASSPITTTLGARLATKYTNTRGWIENLDEGYQEPRTGETVPPPERWWPNADEFLGRLTLDWIPTSDWGVNLKVTGAHTDQNGVIQAIEPVRCLPTNFTVLDPGEPCKRDWKGRYQDLAPGIARQEPEVVNRRNGKLYFLYDSYDIVMNTTYDWDVVNDWAPVHVTSVTGFHQHGRDQLSDNDVTSKSLIWVGETLDYDMFSQELRVHTAFSLPVNATMGLFYQQQDLSLNVPFHLAPVSQDPSSGRFFSFDLLSKTDGQTWSGFAELAWDVMETLELTSGARLTRETKDSFAENTFVHPAFLPLFTEPGERLTDSFKDTDLSPEVSLSWHPTLSLMLYGAYKEGFKSGGFNNLALLRRDETTKEDLTFDSETAAGFEGGMKSTWFDNALALNLIGYDYLYEDLQINVFDDASVNFTTKNAGKVTTRGFELDVRWLPPVDGLSIQGALAFNRARYEEFITECFTGQTFEEGCNRNADGEPSMVPRGEQQDLSGTARIHAPEWAASWGFDYGYPLPRLPIVGNVMAEIGGSFQYQDNYLVHPRGRRLIQDAVIFSGARVGLSSADGDWGIGLVGKNLGNEHTIMEGDDLTVSGGDPFELGAPFVGKRSDMFGYVNRPRQIGLNVTIRY